MSKVHIFKGNVHHDKKAYIKGQACPDQILEVMLGKGLVEPLPEAIKPVAVQPEAQKPKSKE